MRYQRLSLKRQTSPEHEAFAEKVRSISGPGAEPTPLFDFQLVRKLSEAEPVVREWQPVGMGALQVELSHVIEQAGPLGHTSIVELCKRLLQIYQQLSMKPADSVVETLLSAHETLVHMFDELASSQTIQSGSEILQKLDDLDRDLKAPKATEAISRSLLPLDALLPELDTRLENLNSEAASQEALQAVLSQLSELQGVDDLVVTFELMLQIAEVAEGQEEPLGGLLSSCRLEADRQIVSLRTGVSLATDENLAASVRGALSARQSQAQAVGEVVESAPETPPEEIGEQNLLPEDDVDPDILELFLEEAEELSEAIDDSILVWGSDTEIQST